MRPQVAAQPFATCGVPQPFGDEHPDGAFAHAGHSDEDDVTFLHGNLSKNMSFPGAPV